MRTMASHSSSKPSPREATVLMIGGASRSHVVLRRGRVEHELQVRHSLGVPSRSALLTTNRSAISSRPALAAWTASPQPGFTTTIVGRPPRRLRSRPGRRRRSRSGPRACRRREDPHRLRRGQRQPAEVARGGHRPDEDARVGGMVLHSDPVAGGMAPPENGLDGSMASTPTSTSSLRTRRSACRSRRLAAPGAPVIPTCRPTRCGIELGDGAWAESPPRSTIEIKRAMEARSPARRPRPAPPVVFRANLARRLRRR